MVVWRGPGANILAALWLLGVPALLGRGSWALRIGTALLLAWLPVELAVRLSPILYPSLWSPKGLPSPVLIVASVATALLGSAAVLSLGLGAFFSGARRLGAGVLILGGPAGSP